MQDIPNFSSNMWLLFICIIMYFVNTNFRILLGVYRYKFVYFLRYILTIVAQYEFP